MLVLLLLIVIQSISAMPKPSFDHEKLHVYQAALRFTGFVGSTIEKVPVKLAVRDQLDRASTSIVLNIAEGNGKRSQTDRCRFLDIARGSAFECAACLDILVIKKQLEPSQAEVGKEQLVGIVSMLIGLLDRFGAQLHEDAGSYAESVANFD